MFGLHTFLPSIVRQRRFEIMDMKICAAIPLNMRFLDFRRYNILFCTNTFIEKKT